MSLANSVSSVGTRDRPRQNGLMSRRGILRCLLAAVLFGATAPAASELAGSIPAFTLAGLLYLGAAIAVLPSVVRQPPTRRALVAEWRPAGLAVIAGGAIGPVLLVAGLARTSAASASILLNTELAATVVLAALLFHEHLGRRLLVSAALITAAGGLLTWNPNAAFDVGAILIVAACICWGLDNCVTAGIQQLAPEHVVALKGIIAGGANLTIGLLVSGVGTNTSAADLAWGLVIGAAGYGLSITLWVKGARDLGAARGQVIFAAAPFIGATIAWTLLDEPVTTLQGLAVMIALAGVVVSLDTSHAHSHHHDPLAHDHEHTHDDGHHDDHHDDGHHDDGHHDDQERGSEQFAGVTGRHSHAHVHRVVAHSHPHVPDLHHRHGHD